MMKRVILLLTIICLPLAVFAQNDRHEVRSGNRKFKKDDFQSAEINYKKARLKDSISNAAIFMLLNTY